MKSSLALRREVGVCVFVCVDWGAGRWRREEGGRGSEFFFSGH